MYFEKTVLKTIGSRTEGTLYISNIVLPNFIKKNDWVRERVEVRGVKTSQGHAYTTRRKRTNSIRECTRQIIYFRYRNETPFSIFHLVYKKGYYVDIGENIYAAA